MQQQPRMRPGLQRLQKQLQLQLQLQRKLLFRERRGVKLQKLLQLLRVRLRKLRLWEWSYLFRRVVALDEEVVEVLLLASMPLLS